jgi:hypothetical protein
MVDVGVKLRVMGQAAGRMGVGTVLARKVY